MPYDILPNPESYLGKVMYGLGKTFTDPVGEISGTAAKYLTPSGNPHVTSAMDANDPSRWSSIPDTAIDMPPILTSSNSAQSQAQRDKNLDAIREDPQNQNITDASVADDNQDYMEGLFSSVGELEKQQMAYNERMTKDLMEWYETMSNTAYQRAMADMKAAGLNPILAYSQGGASTPSVHPMSYSMGGGDTFTDFVNMITNGASNLLKAIANFLPTQQASKLLEVSKELSYNKKGKLESIKTSNTYG